MIAAVLAVLLAGPGSLSNRPIITQQPNAVDPNHPFFEFAPLSAAGGLTTSCACTAVTGTKGEVMTFTRASSATCLKTIGTTLTNIVPGDMVTCASGQPRVMPGTDGTNWNGLLGEKSATNFTPRSQEFDNAAWSKASQALALPVVTADVSLSPLNTLTADRLQVPASAFNVSYSQIFISGCNADAVTSGSLFLKGHGGTSGTLDLCTQGGITVCKACVFNGAAWSRCPLEGVGGSPTLIIIGSNAIYGAGSGALGAAADVDIWGAQCETGAISTSYIATAGVSATRVTEVEDVAISWPAGKTQFCTAATVAGIPSFWVAGWSVLGLFIDELAPGTASTGSHTFWPYYNAPNASIDMTGSAATAAGYVSSLSITLSTTHRFVEYHNGSLMNNCMDGACAAGAASSFLGPAWARVRIGRASSANELSPDNAVVKGVMLDDSYTRCQ